MFLDLLTHSYFRISDASVIVMDECHHAQSNKDHTYTRIMKDWYDRAKREGRELPRILGLTACLMVKSVPVYKFHTEKEILEKIMDSKVETTEDLYDILKYVTSPHERISVFRDNLEDVTQKKIFDQCSKTQELLHNIMEGEMTRIFDEAPNIQMKAVAEKDLKNHFKIMKNEILGSIVEGVSSLGLIAIKLTLDNFKLMFRKVQDASVRAYYGIEANSEMACVMQACLGSLEQIVSQIRLIPGDLKSLEALSSSKMLALVDILRNNQGCSTIIFVKTKYSAETINDILKEYSYSDPGLSGTSSDFAVSPGAKVNPRHPDPVIRQKNIELINEERRKLQTTLSNFKSSQHPTNTLVSTNVVEEGLDVRSCNLVIKFDFPDNFRSYVQSKGRARARPSHYILMVSEAERGKLEKKYNEYLAMEELSLRECHKRPFEGLPMGPETDLTRNYVANTGDPESAIITGSQAVRLVHKYIQQIKVDRFTKLTCVYETHEVKDREGNMVGYQTRCHMPHRTPFTAPVKGEVERSKKTAKQHCALVICELLHFYQELDQRLKVKKRKYIHDEDDEAEDGKEDGYNPNNRKVGTRKRRQFYEKEHPLEMKFDPQSSSYFLSKVQFTLIRKNESYKYREFAPDSKGEQLGLLTTLPLPEFSPIPIHHPGGEYSAQVSSVQVTGVDVDSARNFTEFIMTNVLKVSDAMSPTTGDFLIVPIKDTLINVKLLRSFSDESGAEIKKLSLDPFESLSYDSVIFPSYKTSKENYFVEEFVPESVLNIQSKMPNSRQTFAEYFESTYGLRIRNMDQNLIRLASADKRSYMLKPCEDTKKSKKDIYNTTFLVPELVEIEPISRMLWKQCQMLPFVLHRMSSLIGSKRLLVSLGYKGIERLSVPTVELSSPLNLFDNLLEVDSTKPSDSVTPGDVLHAATLRAANDQFDMERLEILGDCFLKYYTGVFLFHKLSGESTINTEEGDLTTKRSRVVGNKNLCLIARSLGLAQCLVSAQMEPHTTWLPPGLDRRSLERKLIEDLDSKFGDMIEDGEERKKTLSVGSILNWICDEDLGLVVSDPDELLKRSTERFRNSKAMGLKLKSFSLINDKSLADCVEALIGCFLLKTGSFGALKFMSKIGLDMSSSNTVDDLLARKISNERVEIFNPPRHGFSEDDVGDAEMQRAELLYQKLGVSEIENIIDYKFREKSFLLQAFTHASYCDNRLTGSFERLEYLGDGVLDYLVTVYIYTQLGQVRHISTSDQDEHHYLQDKDPGKITDIRSAVVCNNMFAR